MAVGNITVRHFRFRNDDGSESTATWKGLQDAGVSVTVAGSDVLVRLRLMLENNTSDITAAYGLKVSKNGGAAASVGSASSNVRGTVSANLTDGANTTNQLTVPGGDTYTTTGGVANNTSAASGSLALTVAHVTEVEWAVLLRAADLANGDTLDFTVYAVSGAPAFTQFAGNVRITVSSPAHAFTVSPASQSVHVGAISGAITVALNWVPGADEVFTLSDNGGGGSIYPAIFKVPAGSNSATFSYMNLKPGTYTLTVTDVTSSLGAQSVTVLVEGFPDWQLRLYDSTGKRKKLPTDAVVEVEFEVTDRGGYSRGSFKTFTQWDEFVPDGTERVDIYYRGVLVYRGYLRIPGRRGDENAESAFPVMYGLMEKADRWACDRLFVYQEPVDVSVVFTDIVNQYIAISGRLPTGAAPLLQTDIQTIGSKIQRLDAKGKSVTQALNALCDLVPNEAVWGFDVDGTSPVPANRIYLRPRSQTVAFRVGVGGEIVQWENTSDLPAIVNKVRFKGGKVIQKNLMTNGGLEQVEVADEGIGNWLVNGDFEGGSSFWTLSGGTGSGPTVKAVGDAGAVGSARSGNHWLEIDSNGEQAQQTVTVRTGSRMRFGVWARLEQAVNPNSFVITLEGLTAGGAGVTLVSLGLSSVAVAAGSDAFGGRWGGGKIDSDVYHFYWVEQDWASWPTVAKARCTVRAQGGAHADDGVLVDDCSLNLMTEPAQVGWHTYTDGAATIADFAWAVTLQDMQDEDASATGPRTGWYCAKLKAANIAIATDNFNIYQPRSAYAQVSPNERYTMGVWVQTNNQGTCDFSFGVVNIRSDGTQHTKVETAVKTAANGYTWVLYTLEIQTDSDAVALEPFFRVRNNHQIYVDDMFLCQGEFPDEIANRGGYWEGDTYQRVVDVTYSPLADAAQTGGAVISSAAAASITNYGTQEATETNIAVVDLQSLIVWAVGYFNGKAVPKQQGVLTILEPKQLITPSGTVKIINLRNAPDALFPSRMRTRFPSSGQVEQEIDLGNERPDFADFLRLTERRAQDGFRYTE